MVKKISYLNNGEMKHMQQQAYILGDNSIGFSKAVARSLCLMEFAYDQANRAGLQAELWKPECPSEMQNGIFLRADADFDPDELGRILGENQRKNAVLFEQNGATLGYLIGAAEGEMPDVRHLDALPRVLLRHARRITPQNYAEIFALRQRSTRERYQHAGVFFESEEVTVSPLYTIGQGTLIGRGSVLTGRGRIGENCSILSSRLENAVLGEGVSVTNSVLTDCKVGDGSVVGPFAYLRPRAEIGKGARIGDFVEIKNSKIDDGTKVSHLTYIGDSDVGKGVNFGCGTVTSNYDGSKKYRTRIGDHAFIGCNTNLVAPVTVGKNAYIAAGSTITHPVPEAALAIARQRQINKENWVQDNKPELIK